MTWAAIRDGFAVRLNTISGLSVSDVFIDSSPNSTFAMVLPGEPVWSYAGHGALKSYNVIVRVQCVRATLKDSQDALDAYLSDSGASSVIAAVAADDTLAGTAHAIKIIDVRNYGRVENTQGAGADIAFEVRGAT
jgi:environmental stress-induced protein Ves